jgi:AcrR family transcriptional regulator
MTIATSTDLSSAQRRTIAVALEMFARHGVGGTSLQMIADELGVTKAAVYHQFKTKDEIVLAAGEAELAQLLPIIEAAEAQRSVRKQRQELLAGMVDLAVESRRTVRSMLGDPALVDFFNHNEFFRDVMRRLRRLLVGEDPAPEARVRPAMLIAAISGAVIHPFVADVEDDVLREELLRLGRRFLGLPG